MEKTTKLSEKALLYKSAIDLDNKKRQESQKVLEKVTLLLEAPSVIKKTKALLGWDEEENKLSQEKADISFLEDLQSKYPKNLILDQEEVLKLCIEHDYVLISANKYKYKTSKELVEVISEYLENNEHISIDDIKLLIPNHLDISTPLSEAQIIEYRNSVKTDDILVLHRVIESRNADINYYSCLTPLNNVKKDTRNWFKKLFSKPIYTNINAKVLGGLGTFILILTLILLGATAIGNVDMIEYYFKTILIAYCGAMLLSLIIVLFNNTKEDILLQYKKYSMLYTANNTEEMRKSNLAVLLTNIYYLKDRGKFLKFNLEYFTEIINRDKKVILKNIIIICIFFATCFLQLYYGYYAIRTNNDSKTYTIFSEEREEVGDGIYRKVLNTYEIKRNNYFSYTKTKINSNYNYKN